MKKRIISSLALWGCLIVLVFWLEIEGAILILALFSTGAHWELCHIWKKAGQSVAPVAGTIAGSLLIPAAYYMHEPLLDFLKDPWAVAASLGLTSVLLAWVLILVFSQGTRFKATALGPTALSVLYVPFLLHFFLYLLKNQDVGLFGLFLCIWVLITAKFTDMGALLTGKYLGRHKMAPKLSPKKTWEGAIGGTIIAVITAVFAAHLANQNLTGFNFELRTAAGLALLISIVGQIGDLVESGFKRKANVKDSGNSIPGIGGALDLMDSLILNAPLAFFLLSKVDFGQS